MPLWTEGIFGETSFYCASGYGNGLCVFSWQEQGVERWEQKGELLREKEKERFFSFLSRNHVSWCPTWCLSIHIRWCTLKIFKLSGALFFASPFCFCWTPLLSKVLLEKLHPIKIEKPFCEKHSRSKNLRKVCGYCQGLGFLGFLGFDYIQPEGL